jgi:protein involved in polysaccharide export with SLBB domain
MQSGGPSAAGSFRQIELRRAGKSVTTFDFYDLLLRGDKGGDSLLQADDVIHIGPVGPQVAMIGSVNNIGIYELKPGDTINDLLNMAGGFAAVAERGRVMIERLESRNDTRIVQLSLPQHGSQQPRSGDVVRALSAISATLPQHKQNRRIRVEGEVVNPGEYILPPGSTLHDAVKAAGGLTSGAFIFGTELNRETVRASQEANYDRALRDLETEFTRNSTTQKATTGDEAAAQSARSVSTDKLIQRLRAVRPTGRIVLELPANASALPALDLEDGDRLLIPAKPTTVGVFGSVFNGGSYLFGRGGTVNDFLRLAGGPTRGADTSSVFVLRANGSVVSARQKSGWILAGGNLDSTVAEPGDTIFVPEELNKTSFIQEAKEWTQILYQFGLGAAALKTIRN